MKVAKQRGKLRLAGQKRAGPVDNRPIWRSAMRRAGIDVQAVKEWNVK